MSRSVRKNRIRICGPKSGKSYKKDYHSKERAHNKRVIKNHAIDAEEDCHEYLHDKWSIAWDIDKIYNYHTWEEYRVHSHMLYEKYGFGGPKDIANPTKEQLDAHFWAQWKIKQSK